MKKAHLFLGVSFLLLLFFSACTSEPPADKIKGSYNCECRLYTRYMKDGKWRDTAYISKENNSVVITRVDDNTVSVKASSKKWGTVTVDRASVSDYNYEGNFSGDGIFDYSNHQYDASISGSVSYESHDLAVSARVPSYPNSGGKYILSFTNNR